MDYINGFIKTVTAWTARVGQVALAAAMLIIVANIILREIWKPLPGTVEIVEIMGALLLSLGIAYCAVDKGHIAVGVLVDKLPEFREAVVELVVSAISCFFVSFLAWEMASFATSMMHRGYTTGHLHIPLYPFIYVVSFGFLMLSLVLLRDILEAIRGIVLLKGRDNK
ncbi:MAG: TRAP transporter small permease [Candidatus Syntrophonatronum acetioxidans]|uniref:TRAP transporter small permease n=1 Tax=Candidatus Syntrophonatronum acetioxidans TaxID=1795816 RepID=A0A424YD69_9FIRM|nr:MAG: TRAP transporter small permease [Candidatus Syntrophonatronum acetioxidans]